MCADRASARSPKATGLQAEVQSFFSDGGVALHTRSAKYGRLSRGQLVCVPPVLIKRLKQHFCTLAAHKVDVVLGCNGWVWVQARLSSAHKALNASLMPASFAGGSSAPVRHKRCC